MREYKFLDIIIEDELAFVYINNNRKANALNRTLWFEIGQVFYELSQDARIKVCILAGKGKHFSSGIDLNFLKEIMSTVKGLNQSERQDYIYNYIKEMQESFASVEKCKKPVIAAIHGACIGGAIDLISSCDLRFSTIFTSFSIMETRLGIVADMGTLQRLRTVVSEANLKELTYTSKVFTALQAKKYGLINRVYYSKSKLMAEVKKLAYQIAKMPDYAVQGSKEIINYSRDHSVTESLDRVAKLNARLLLSEESEQAFQALQKRS